MKIYNMLDKLKMDMIRWEYPVQNPIKKSFIESIIKRESTTEASLILDKITDELCVLFANHPDYITFLKCMDSFEYNGLTLYSLSVLEPIIKNLFVMNEFYRNNDDYIDPDLATRLVMGENGTSLFTYDTKMDLFEIRDNVATESIYGSFNSFADFLAEILDTVK